MPEVLWARKEPALKLFVCWGTFPGPGARGHACHRAHTALRSAGFDPELVRSYGSRILPEAANLTPGRREVKRLTGDVAVPVLVTDEEEVVAGSEAIERWAAERTPRPEGSAEAPRGRREAPSWQAGSPPRAPCGLTARP
jgi:glutathione S-transferase